MKKRFLLLIAGFISSLSFGQDPDLYGHWELDRIEIKFSAGIQISEVDPPIAPYLIINEDLEFNGFGACNSFSGSFTYDGRLNPINYVESTEDCETQYHDLLEDEYFMYFKGPNSVSAGVFTGNDGLEHMHMGLYPGYFLDFIRGQLSLPEPGNPAFTIYPNPTSEVLFITSNGATIENISVYNTLGQKVLQPAPINNSINVSVLQKGIYFIELTTENAKAVQKFIKN